MAVTDAPIDDTAFRVEQRGIDHVPVDERWARPRDLCAMWAGSGLQFEYLVYGALLMTFGFTFAQAIALIVIGNVSYLFLGLCSLQGPGAGTTVFTISRAGWGPNGARLIAFFNWITQIGFESEGLILVVLAAEALTAKAGYHTGTGLKVVFIVAAALVQSVLPLLGHATVVKTLRALTVPFVIFFVLLASLTLGHARFGAVHHGASWQLFLVGLAFTITLSGLGWVENGNDYSRYLPTDASPRAIVGYVFVGGAVPEILVMSLGAAVATFVPTAGGNPISDFPHAFPGWFLVPFLIVTMIQLFGINSLDLYSSGVTLQALGLSVRRWQAVLVDTVLAGGVTTYAVFSSSFSKLLEDFVAVVIVWIAPWMAIFLVDWVLRGRRYVPAELQRTDRGGLYFRRGGVHWPAVVAHLLGGA
ncbi:MAG: purine-cytosine permease family protein, partial [Actinomycetes bacterium]